MTDGDPRASTTRAYDHIVDDFVRRNSEVSGDFDEFRAAFVAMIPAGGRVADLGCGPGRDAAHFVGAGLEVVAIDASVEMALRARGSGAPVARADIRSVPLRDGSLDGIFSAASLLHVPRVDVPTTLRAWWDCLRPAGALALATSLGGDEGWEVCPYEPSPQATTAPLRRWFVHHRADDLLHLLDAAGFEVESTRERVSHRRWLQVIARRRQA